MVVFAVLVFVVLGILGVDVAVAVTDTLTPILLSSQNNIMFVVTSLGFRHLPLGRSPS